MLWSLLRKYEIWRLEHETVNRLRLLEDRQLDDVGTDRDNIETFVADVVRARLD